MDKQSTLAFVLMGIVLVVWLYFNSPQPNQQPVSTNDTTLVKNQVDKKVTEEKQVEDTQKAVENSIPKKADNNADELFQTSTENAKIITIENDLFKLEMTSKGGKIHKYYLKDYETWYYDKYDESDFYNTHVQLINQTNGGDLDLVFYTAQGKVNTAQLNFETTADNYYYNLSGSDSLTLTYTYTVDGDKEIKKNFTFYGNNYLSSFNIELVNMNSIIADRRYDVVWASGLNFLELNSVDEAIYANSSFYSGGEYFVVNADAEDEPVERDLNGKID